jgi:hypothetical protein
LISSPRILMREMKSPEAAVPESCAGRGKGTFYSGGGVPVFLFNVFSKG